MRTLIDILLEYSAIDLAQRAARIHGKRSSFGKWDKVEKGGHIPLKYDGRLSSAAATKLYRIEDQLGKDFEANFKSAKFQISDLRATQTHVKTSDAEKLANKLLKVDLSHVRIATHKGNHFIIDGHHAIMSARLNGMKEVEVLRIDLDSFK